MGGDAQSGDPREGRQRFRPLDRAVDDPDLDDTGIRQTDHRRARRAAGPEDHGGTVAKTALQGSRCARADILDEPVGIRVGGGETTVVADNDGVDRADPLGRLVNIVDQRKRGLLVGHRQVHPPVAIRRQSGERRRQVFRGNGNRLVAARDPVAREPVAMQGRGQGVPHRPAHDARFRFHAHAITTRSPRRKSRSGRSGNPRIE